MNDELVYIECSKVKNSFTSLKYVRKHFYNFDILQIILLMIQTLCITLNVLCISSDPLSK